MFFSSWLIVPKSPELARLAQLLEGGVGPVDVGLVVLAVVQLEDLRREVRLEGASSRRAVRGVRTWAWDVLLRSRRHRDGRAPTPRRSYLLLAFPDLPCVQSLLYDPAVSPPPPPGARRRLRVRARRSPARRRDERRPCQPRVRTSPTRAAAANDTAAAFSDADHKLEADARATSRTCKSSIAVTKARAAELRVIRPAARACSPTRTRATRSRPWSTPRAPSTRSAASSCSIRRTRPTTTS